MFRFECQYKIMVMDVVVVMNVVLYCEEEQYSINSRR